MANMLVRQKESIVDQLEQLHQRIARRAYDLFRGRNGWGDAFGDWLSAEQELVWKPAVELREKDGSFTLAAALPGVDAKDITVDITPQDVVIQARPSTTHRRQRSGPSLRIHGGPSLPLAAVPKDRRPGQSQGRVSERDAPYHRTGRRQTQAKRVDIKAA